MLARKTAAVACFDLLSVTGYSHWAASPPMPTQSRAQLREKGPAGSRPGGDHVRGLIDTLRQVVVVPSEAIQEGPDGDLVYVVGDDDTIEVRPVTARQRGGDQAVIGSGLAAQERVAVTGFARLTEGTRVEVAPAGEAARPAPADAIQRRATDAKAKGQRAQRAGAAAGP